MESIRIENLRCFKDTGEIKLSPLSIAVGKNSCGKSTILRIFPLFKQTLEAKVSEPILWFGRYVDFGDFKQSINKSNYDKEISFQFNFKVAVRNRVNTDIILVLKIKDGNVNKVNIKLLENEINIQYGTNGNIKGIKVNTNEINVQNDKFRYIEREIIPNIYNIKQQGKYSSNYDFFFNTRKELREKNEIKEKIEEILKLEQSYTASLLIENIEEFFIRNLPPIAIIDREIRKIIDSMNKKNKNGFNYSFNEALNNFDYEYEGNLIQDEEEICRIIDKIKENYKLIFELSLSKNLNYIIDLCNKYLFAYFTNISYIAPLRATAERYYRIQGLAIDDIDSRGENVPMILKNMKGKEKISFENWMLDKFDISITTDSNEGHISLFINKDDNKINIADTGFGYSQILPIILLLWKSKLRKNQRTSGQRFGLIHVKNVKKLIVIEQPELHLHPKMQTQLIDVILDILQETDKINFLIETHSQAIIDHIGSRIENKKINEKNVNILLVEQKENHSSNIRSVSYTSEGYLKEWPIDFFSGDEW